MFLKFLIFYLTTSSFTVPMNFNRKIYWAFLIKHCSSLNTYPKPHFSKSYLSLWSYKDTTPKSTTRIFFDFTLETINIFHILWANFSASEQKALHFIFISFLIVTTACFWKLWFSDFFSPLRPIEIELCSLAGYDFEFNSSSFWIAISSCSASALFTDWSSS